MTGVAVKVTLVPEQAGFAEAAMVTLADTYGMTVSVVLAVAVFDLASVTVTV